MSSRSETVGYGISESTTDGISRNEDIATSTTDPATMATSETDPTTEAISVSAPTGRTIYTVPPCTTDHPSLHEYNEEHNLRALRQRVTYLRGHVEELELTLRVQVLRAQIAHLKRTTRRRKRTNVSTEDATT